MPENPKTNPTEILEEVVGIIGDANADGKVNIKDATVIQKHIAKIDTGIELNIEIADCFKDGKVNIKDATLIQKYIAKYETENVGEELIKYTVVTLPVPSVSTATADETNITTEDAVTTAITTATEAIEVTTALPTTEPETTAEPVTTQAPTEVITTEATEPTTEEVTTTAVVMPTLPEIRTVTFTNSFFWSGEIRCYYWSDSDTAMTVWPGEVMHSAGLNDFGETMYTFEVPEGTDWIIFTNGANQTVDIPFEGEIRYYPISTQDDLGHYNIETW